MSVSFLGLKTSLLIEHCTTLPESIQLTAKHHTYNPLAQQLGEVIDAPLPTELLA